MKIYFLIIILLTISCNNKGVDDNILARVYDKYLHASDVQATVPHGLTGKDSLIAAKNYINNWVKEQLLIEQAERNLTEESQLLVFVGEYPSTSSSGGWNGGADGVYAGGGASDIRLENISNENLNKSNDPRIIVAGGGGGAGDGRERGFAGDCCSACAY